MITYSYPKREVHSTWGRGSGFVPFFKGVAMIREMIYKGYGLKEPQQWPIITGQALDRSKYVTASEIGQCSRKIKFDKLALVASGYSPEVGTTVNPNDDWGYFERGHNVESWVIDLLNKGWNKKAGELRHTGINQVSFTADNQSGTPDGAIFRKATIGALEIKSIDPRTNVTRLPRLNHIDQTIQNTDLMAHHYELEAGDSFLIYVDASNYKKIQEFRVPFDADHATRLEEKANRIMEAASPADLKAEGMFMDKGCDYCAHTAACSMIVRESKGLRNDDTELASKRLFG